MARDNDRSGRGELPLQRRTPGIGPPGGVARVAVFEDDAFGPAIPQQLQRIPLLGFRAGRLDEEKARVPVTANRTWCMRASMPWPMERKF